MDPTPPVAPASPDFEDRHAWLIVFGVFEILLGAFFALLVPLTLLGQIAQTKRGGHPFDFAGAMSGMTLLAVFSACLIWLGIGSALARRWARAVLLCLGWTGLCAGILALAIVLPLLGSLGDLMQQQGRPVPPGAVAVAQFFIVGTFAVFYVLIPGLLVLFYRGENVRRTCEARDPQVRWTDRCPLPVVAACILIVAGAACVIVLPRVGAVMPLAGIIVAGWPARILWFIWAAFSLYAARGFYRLERHVWLAYSIATLFFCLSSSLTFLRIDLLDYYRASGMPEWQLNRLATSPMIRNGLLPWICAFCTLPYLGYLFYLRRFFPAAGHDVTAQPAN